ASRMVLSDVTGEGQGEDIAINGVVGQGNREVPQSLGEHLAAFPAAGVFDVLRRAWQEIAPTIVADDAIHGICHASRTRLGLEAIDPVVALAEWAGCIHMLFNGHSASPHLAILTPRDDSQLI